MPCRGSGPAPLLWGAALQGLVNFFTFGYTLPHLLHTEGAFEAAEPHFLASGQRDSARLLADMFIQWSSVGGTPGPFALRGIIPYVSWIVDRQLALAINFSTGISRTEISLPPVHSSPISRPHSLKTGNIHGYQSVPLTK